ncbi:MAG TPA: hypothetical protein VNO32_24440 [Candidatus Acidoferrum sp.]|nr:hypothetical protein [Candidatus Acidoferrum sp.]
MKHAASASTLILAGFLAMTSTGVCAGGQGGGHGGSGGHGSSGHGGHSSRGSSSGRSSGQSIGHSIGHSFARVFGHRGQAASAAGLTAIPPEHGRVSASPGTVRRVLDRQPRDRFVFRPPNGFFLRRRAFGFDECPDRWFEHNFRFGRSWNCSSDGFFFDPFFFGWFSGSLSYDSAFGGATGFGGGTEPDSAVWSPGEPNPVYQGTISDATNETATASDSTTPSRNGAKAEGPITLLQLRDGSMYGLTDYWVADGELHYRTTYGGENSLPFERIDFEKTVQLNADRGVPFVLPRQSVPR